MKKSIKKNRWMVVALVAVALVMATVSAPRPVRADATLFMVVSGAIMLAALVHPDALGVGHISGMMHTEDRSSNMAQTVVYPTVWPALYGPSASSAIVYSSLPPVYVQQAPTIRTEEPMAYAILPGSVARPFVQPAKSPRRAPRGVLLHQVVTSARSTIDRPRTAMLMTALP